MHLYLVGFRLLSIVAGEVLRRCSHVVREGWLYILQFNKIY